MPKIPISLQHSKMLAPSKEILRMESLNCVNGNSLHISCNHFGKTAIEKKVPDNIICGNPKRLISKGIDVSLFTILLMISPTPISRKSIMTVINNISSTVSNPCCSVKFIKKCPTTISTITFIS